MLYHNLPAGAVLSLGPAGSSFPTQSHKTMTDQEAAKRAAGEAGAALVEDGMDVGLGTGSTTAYAIRALGQRMRTEGLRIQGVATSFASERLAREVGIPRTTLDDVERIDLALDGADEVGPHFNLIKGGGAAHTREKVVARQAERFVVLVDPSKQVEQLGRAMPVPVEVLPMAVTPVLRALERLGAEPRLREAERKDGPVITDQGFWVIDAHFEGIDDPKALDRALNDLPGVLDHGLFLDMATDVLVGRTGEEVEHLQRAAEE